MYSSNGFEYVFECVYVICVCVFERTRGTYDDFCQLFLEMLQLSETPTIFPPLLNRPSRFDFLFFVVEVTKEDSLSSAIRDLKLWFPLPLPRRRVFRLLFSFLSV